MHPHEPKWSPANWPPRPVHVVSQGVPDELLQRAFGSEYQSLIPVIQPLLNQVRLCALVGGNVFRTVPREERQSPRSTLYIFKSMSV